MEEIHPDVVLAGRDRRAEEGLDAADEASGCGFANGDADGGVGSACWGVEAGEGVLGFGARR
jgi:hypothetical protein